MPSRFAPRNRLAAVRKKKSELETMTVSPSSSNGDFLKPDLDEEGWKQSRVLRCSYRVLQLIGNATLTEKVIREALGNNPDTSKALRLLLKRKMIKRVGYGGRSCPFHYQQLSRSPSKESDDKKDTTSSSPEIKDVVQDRKVKKNSTLTMKKEPCDEDGFEPHEVLSQQKPRVSKAPKEPKKPVVKSATGTTTAADQQLLEIPVPGWRLVDD